MNRLTAWWVLARPAGLWLPPLLPLLGYAWAHWDRALLVCRPYALVPVLLAWVALQAGTLWLNAARDRDTGEVLLGRSVPVPPGTAWLGLAGVLLAVVLASIAGLGPGLCAAACAGLSILYSHPATAWKAHPIGGPFVNVVGYGMLSPLAGYLVVGTPLTWRTAATALLLMATTLGWTFVSQGFQEAEDRARGDRTLVATHGARAAITAGRAGLATTGLGLLALVVAGWYPPGTVLGLGPMFWADRVLAGWARSTDLHPAEGGRQARRVVWIGALGLGLTLAGVGVHYFWDSAHSGPVAGLATRGGLPSDRQPRPAAAQQQRDWTYRLRTGQPYRPH